jgi:hypothetical protein
MLEKHGGNFVPDFGYDNNTVAGLNPGKDNAWKSLLDFCCDKPNS